MLQDVLVSINDRLDEFCSLLLMGNVLSFTALFFVNVILITTAIDLKGLEKQSEVLKRPFASAIYQIFQIE